MQKDVLDSVHNQCDGVHQCDGSTSSVAVRLIDCKMLGENCSGGFLVQSNLPKWICLNWITRLIGCAI